jgi:hypothetical protein
MATRIVRSYDDNHVTVQVTDDTGRDDTAKVERYPGKGSENYVTLVDALDSFMYTHDSKRTCEHIHPGCGKFTKGGPWSCKEEN